MLLHPAAHERSQARSAPIPSTAGHTPPEPPPYPHTHLIPVPQLTCAGRSPPDVDGLTKAFLIRAPGDRRGEGTACISCTVSWCRGVVVVVVVVVGPAAAWPAASSTALATGAAGAGAAASGPAAADGALRALSHARTRSVALDAANLAAG